MIVVNNLTNIKFKTNWIPLSNIMNLIGNRHMYLFKQIRRLYRVELYISHKLIDCNDVVTSNFKLSVIKLIL
jgi:hypothetical protein